MLPSSSFVLPCSLPSFGSTGFAKLISLFLRERDRNLGPVRLWRLAVVAGSLLDNRKQLTKVKNFRRARRIGVRLSAPLRVRPYLLNPKSQVPTQTTGAPAGSLAQRDCRRQSQTTLTPLPRRRQRGWGIVSRYVSNASPSKEAVAPNLWPECFKEDNCD